MVSWKKRLFTTGAPGAGNQGGGPACATLAYFSGFRKEVQPLAIVYNKSAQKALNMMGLASLYERETED